MGLDILAFLAVVTITLSEIAIGTTFRLPNKRWHVSLTFVCQDHLRLAQAGFGLALVLLVLAASVAYFVVAVILAGLLFAAAVLRHLPDTFQTSARGNFLRRLLAGAVHLTGLWVLPFCIVWSLSDSYADMYFFSQEIGHMLPATFYIFGLVLLPLLFLPGSCEPGGIEHQKMECILNFLAGIIFFIIFRTAHHFGGENPKTGMSAPNWDHELLGLVWAFCALIGLFYAHQNIQTSVQTSFAAAYVAYSMLSHSASANVEEMSDVDLSMDEMKAWMKLHQIHGMAFGMAALCRLLHRVPESIFLFFLGSWIFPFSAMNVVKWLVALFYDHRDDHYPVDHVVVVVVVTAGLVVYPAYLVALTQMRDVLDETARLMGFTSVSTSEGDGDVMDETDVEAESELVVNGSEKEYTTNEDMVKMNLV